MEARKTCFIPFTKLLFSVLTKRKTIHEARTVNSQNLETVNHIAQVILVLHSAMETHLLTNPKPTYYPNYSIKYFESTDQRIALKLTILDLNYMHFTLIKN